MASRFVLGLDIGTSSLKAAVVERGSRGIVLRELFKEPSTGVRKGTIHDLSEIVPVVARVLERVREIAKPAIKNVYVNIGTPHVKAQHSRGIVAVSRMDSEIYQDDIDRVIKASQAVNLAPNRMIVHTITKEFVVDGVSDIESPIGLSGNRLEVSSVIVDAFSPHVKNVMKAVEVAGGEVGGMVFDPLSAVRAALTKRQKELGVVLVDIGSGTTSMGVYEEGKLIGLQAFPVGGGNITNDIAVGLKIPVDAAEKIKLNYGYALSREVGAKEAVEIHEFVPSGKGSVSRRFISEIIESRLAEMLEFVNNELTLMGKAGQLAGGVVLTGGGAKLPGLAELARQELKLSSQIGFSSSSEWTSEREGSANVIEDPEFVNVLGLVLSCGDKEGWGGERRGSNFSSRFNIKHILQSFIP